MTKVAELNGTSPSARRQLLQGPRVGSNPIEKARQALSNETYAAEQRIKEDIEARQASVGKPGGMSPEEFAAYTQDMRSRLSQLGDLGALSREPGLSLQLLGDIRAKVQNVGRAGGLSSAKLGAYTLDMTFRARHQIPGGPTAPYPKNLRHLVTAVNATEQIGNAKANLVFEQSRLAADMGRARGVSPEVYAARSLDITNRIQKLDQLAKLVQTYELPKDLIDNVLATVKNVGKAAGTRPESLDAKTLDLAFRAQHKISGPLDATYPVGKGHLVSAVNAMEAKGSKEQEIVQEVHSMALNVGKPGGMSPAEFAAYVEDMEKLLEILRKAEKTLRRYELPAPIAREINEKTSGLRKLGGMNPEEFSAFLEEVHARAIGKGPLPDGALNFTR